MSATGLFHYEQCGLDHVWLANGFRVEETEYGSGFAIDHADALHHAIARFIVNSPRPLRGQEARFLRTVLGLSQADMARLLGVDRATVIRWERERMKPLGRIQDIAVRATYGARTAADDFAVSVVRDLQDAGKSPRGERYRVVFEAKRNGWQMKRAA